MKIFLLILFVSLPAHARWAEEKEAGYSIESEKIQYRVEKSGRYTVEVERITRILKDNERTNMGLFRTTFDAHASEFELLDAYTQNGDKKLRVLPEHIEIKPLASSGPGFDEQRQVTIGFREVNVGSLVYCRYRRKIKKPSIPNFFAVEFSIGWGELARTTEFSFNSEVPLFSGLHDPGNYLQEKRDTKGKRHLLTIRLKKPVYRTVTEEEDVAIDPLALPWIGVSTVGSWAEFPEATPRAYEDVIAGGKLPDRFLPIYMKAKGQSSDVDQINSVTSEIAAMIRYVGDWVPVEGLNHPRPLQVVADTGFGDCKDFSTLTATVLRKLGFESHAAWTNRGKNFVISPLSLPTAAYNHAIVYAKKNGREYWVDPTNTTSFAQGVFEDIADREALVLEPGHLRALTIPAPNSSGSAVLVNMQLRFQPEKMLEMDGKFELKGRASVGMTAIGLTYEKSHTDYQFASWLTDPSNLLEWKLPAYDLSSRVVKDFQSNFHFVKRWNPVHTSAGLGYLVPVPPYINQFQFRRQDRVSNLYIPDPKIWKREIFFHGKRPLRKGSVDCRVKSKWINFSRRFFVRGGTLVASDEVEPKVSRIPLADIQSPAFARLQDEIADCANPSVVVFQ